MPKLTLAFRDRLLRSYALPNRPVTIGSAADCDIQIDSLAVEPHHARIVPQGDEYVLEQVQPGGTASVNGQPVTSVALKHNDVIGIGKHILTFLADSALVRPTQAEHQAALPNTGWLQFLDGEHVGKVVRIKSALTDLSSLGLEPALIARRADGYYLSTLQNGERLSIDGHALGDSTARLDDGATIRVGDVTMQFYLREQ